MTTTARPIPNEPDDDYVPPVASATTKAARTNVDVGFEAALLAGMLTDQRAIQAAIDTGLTPAAFAGPAHDDIYGACVDVWRNGKSVEPLTVDAKLHNNKRYADIGGIDYLINLSFDNVPAIKGAATYAARIHETWTTREAILRLDQAAHQIAKGGDPHATVLHVLEQLPASPTHSNAWAPVDLAAQTVIEERPYLFTRSDGYALFYMGKVNSLSGPPESAKSWVALIGCAELARRGQHSVYIDYEDNPASVAGRLRLLGLNDRQLGYVHYYWPDTSIAAACDAIASIGEPIDLVVVDSNTRATLAAGGKTNSTDDAASLGRTLTRIARTSGAGVLVLDHVAKDDDPNDPYSRGSGDKLAYIDGAAYKVKVTAVFAPGRVGRSEIICVKDRPGGARETFAGGRGAASFTLTSDELGAPVKVTVDPVETTTEPSAPFRPTGYMERLSRALEMVPAGVGTKELRSLVSGRGTVIDAAVRALIAEGHVAVSPGARGAKLHTVKTPFREHPQAQETTSDHN